MKNPILATALLVSTAVPRQRQQAVQQQQTSLNANAQGDLALACVNAATPEFLANQGFSGIVDNGVGDLTLTLVNQANLTAQAIVQVTAAGTLAVAFSATADSTTGIRIRCWTLTVAVPPVIAAADVTFWVRITPLAPQ